MGGAAGQLLYGVEISAKDFARLGEIDYFDQHYIEKPFYSKPKTIEQEIQLQDYNLKIQERDAEFPVEICNPYETEDYYVLIRSTNVASCNGGRGIGKHIATNPEWDSILQ